MLARAPGTLEKMQLNVFRQTYHIFEDQEVGLESRDRNQVNYFEEAFSTMWNPVKSLFSAGTIVGSRTAAVFNKVKLPVQPSGALAGADIDAIYPIIDGNENNSMFCRFKRSLMTFTFANPNTYAVSMKMERFGWAKRYTITADESLITRYRQYTGQQWNVGVALDSTGVSGDVRYPTNHDEPLAGNRDSFVTYNAWEGHVGRDLKFAAFAIKKLSSRKWVRLLPGGVVSYKLARGSVAFPVKAAVNSQSFNHHMQYMLRCCWKSDMGMIDGSGPDKALVITADPVLACKITHRYRVAIYEMDVAGPYNILVRSLGQFTNPLAAGQARQAQPVQAGNVAMQNAF